MKAYGVVEGKLHSLYILTVDGASSSGHFTPGESFLVAVENGKM
jgi:hypothetical protein